MPNFIPVDKQTVLITGAAGYICSWIVKTYLDEGFSVRATVRDLKDFAKISHMNEFKKILVIKEQGVGDEIIYSSMYPDLIHKFKNLNI